MPPSSIVSRCRNPRTTHTLSTTTTKAEDIRRLNRDISSIDQQIQFLPVKRISLLKQLNSIQSVSYTITSEILSYIMLMVVKDKTTRHSSFIPLHLSAVSSHWRQVARSTPALWTSLRLEFDESFSVTTFVKNKVPLLHYYLERAKSLPLSLVYCNCEKNSETIKPLLDIAVRHNPTRIKSLTAPVEEVAAWQGNQTVYAQLKTLYITGPSNKAPSKWTLPIAPKLQHLILVRTIISSIPSTANITNLELSNVPYQYCIRLFLECRKTLVDIDVFHPTNTTSIAIPPPALGDKIYTFPLLRTLGCDLSSQEDFEPLNAWDTFILQHINAPSLCEVSFSQLTEKHIQLGTPTLLKTTSSPLSLVFISRVPFPPGALRKREIAQLLDQVDTKKLYIGFEEVEFLRTLHILTPSLHPTNKLLVPSLEELWVTYYMITEEKIPSFHFDSIYEALVKMLQERLGGETGTLRKPFFLAFEKEDDNIVPRASDEMIQDLTNRGVLKLTRCALPGHEDTDRFLVTFERD